MPSDFSRIQDNVQSMIDQDAPAEHIDQYLGEEGFTPNEFKTAVGNYGSFVSAIKRGGKSTGSLIADFLPAMGADLLSKIAPESWQPTLASYREKQMQEAAKTQQEMKLLPAEFESYKEVNTPLDALNYAKEAVGESIPSMLPGVVTGGIGSLVGRGAIAAAGEVAGQQAAKRYLASEAAQTVGAELAAKRAAEEGIKAGAKATAKKALQIEASSALVGSAALNMPDAYQAIYDPKNQDSLLPALASGAFNSVLDAITPVSMLRTIKHKGLTGEAIGAAWYKRGARELGKGVLTEGATEALQEMSNAKAEQFVKDNPEFFTPQNLTRFIDAGLKGGLGGGTMQGAIGAVAGKGPVPQVTPQPTPAPAPAPQPTIGEGAVQGQQGELFGAAPEGRLPEKVEPVFKAGEVQTTETPGGTLTDTGKIQGYQAAEPLPPEVELTGEQQSLLPVEQQQELALNGLDQQEIKRSELRNLYGERIEPLVNTEGEKIAEKPKPINQEVVDVLTAAKQDPAASKTIKGNNAATTKDVVSRIEALVSTGLNPVEAIEQIYMQDKTGKYPVGIKPLSDAKIALLEEVYAKLTNQGNIEDASALRARSIALQQAQQAELFPEGGVDGGQQQGQAQPTTGATGTDVGVSGEPGTAGTPEGATGAGFGGMGVAGGESGVAGPIGGEAGKPTTLTPEEAWLKHKNDDHPDFGSLNADEQALWADMVANNRGNAVDFRKLVDAYNKRTTQEEVTNKKIDEKTFAEYDASLRENIDDKLKGKHVTAVVNFLTSHGPEANQQMMQAVNKRLEDMKKAGYKFTFNIVNQPSASWAGQMDPYKIHGTMQVQLNRSHGGTTYRTATHEFIHAVGYSLIDYGKKHPKTKEGKLVAELTELQKYIVNYLEEKQKTNPDSLTPFENQILASRKAKHGKQSDNALGLRWKSGKLGHEVDELTTWGLTDGRMIATLDSIPYKNKTAGQAFIDIIRKLLGISNKQDTAFNQLLRLTNELFEMPSSNTGIIPLQYMNPLQSQAPTEAVAPSSGTIIKPVTGMITKLQPTVSSGEQTIATAKKILNSYNDSDFWTRFRIAAVDKVSGLSKTLSSLPIFQDGQLRADMLVRSFSQVINLIKNGLQTGIPTINSDGSVVIQRSENNLARSQLLADQLDANPYVQQLGLSGRGFVAEIARRLRGEEILREDESIRAQAAEKMAEAKAKRAEARRLYKEGGSLGAVEKLRKQADAIQRDWADAVELNRETQVTEDHIAEAKQWAAAVPQVNDVLDIWREINMGLIDLNEAAGNLSKETADKYRSKKAYVPLFASRVDLESTKQEGYTGKRGGTKSVAQQLRLEGSNLERNIWENMDKYYASATASAYQNQTRKVAVRQLMSAGIDAAQFADFDNEKVNLRYRDPDSEHANRDGVVSVILDNPNDLAAFQMMNYELGPLMKGISATTQVLRAGALINPMYWIKQLIRDPIHASLVANSSIVTPFHAAKEYINILANNSEEARLLASRGVIGQVDSTIDLHKYLNQVGTEKVNPSAISKMMHKVMQMHEASDAATRVALYKMAYAEAIKAGASKEDATNLAVHKARESINFSSHGNSKTLNALRHMIPFFSASLTSIDTLYRAATGYGLNPEEKKAAQTLFAKRAAMMVVLSTAYAMMLQDDEDYKKLPDNVKDNNWLFPSPVGSEHTFIKIPVPFEVGFFFKTIPEVSVRYMADTSTGKEVVASILGGIKHNLPGEAIPLPQAIKPGIEAVTNYSFFTGRPIEGMGDQGLPVEFRGAHASELAKTLSSFGLSGIGLSPAKIDHLIQGYMAELGTFSSNIAGSAVNAVTGKELPSKNLEQQPFFKAFLTNPNTSKAASDYYDLAHNAQETVNAFNRFKKEGRIEEAQAMLQNEDQKKLMAAAPALRRVQEQMAKIRANMNIIEQNQKVDPDTRRDEINRLQTIYDRVARQGVALADKLELPR